MILGWEFSKDGVQLQQRAVVQSGRKSTEQIFLPDLAEIAAEDGIFPAADIKELLSVLPPLP